LRSWKRRYTEAKRIGDFVELAQLGHHQFTDHQRFDFALAGGAQAALDVRQRRFQALDAHRALFQRALHAGAQLVFVEGLARAVLLDQPRQHQLGGFEGGETLAAGRIRAGGAPVRPRRPDASR
jgi:hypothetical protein